MGQFGPQAIVCRPCPRTLGRGEAQHQLQPLPITLSLQLRRGHRFSGQNRSAEAGLRARCPLYIQKQGRAVTWASRSSGQHVLQHSRMNDASSASTRERGRPAGVPAARKALGWLLSHPSQTPQCAAPAGTRSRCQGHHRSHGLEIGRASCRERV